MKVESLNCPNCGSGVARDSTLCEFCKSRLKTIGCTKCLGLMFVGTKFCGHCGAIAAPVHVSMEEDAGKCPRCRKPLETLKVEELSFRGCTSCDGLWVGAQTFETVCADSERQASVLGFLSQRKTRPYSLTKVNYVPCPDCSELMNRSNFARASGVIVDICKPHGVWFDSDELPSIIEFVQKGGMDLAREKQKLEIQAEREKLRDDQRRAAATERRFGGQSAFADADESGIRGFVQSLFN